MGSGRLEEVSRKEVVNKLLYYDLLSFFFYFVIIAPPLSLLFPKRVACSVADGMLLLVFASCTVRNARGNRGLRCRAMLYVAAWRNSVFLLVRGGTGFIAGLSYLNIVGKRGGW